MTASATLAEVIGCSRHLLFDFDGPICSIFAGLPAPSVAAHLRELVNGRGIEMPAAVQAADDPFEVFRFAATISADLAEHVEAELREMEIRATETARATPRVRQVIEAARGAGRGIAAVSNNSHQAVAHYLTAVGLAPLFSVVIGRTDPDPLLLKQNPHLIIQAIKDLGGAPAECVLIGDSVSDIEGAHNAGTLSIGYADKPGKAERFASAHADAVITSMGELLEPLKEPRTCLSSAPIRGN